MGAAASIPSTLDEKTAKHLAGDHWDASKWAAAPKDADGNISKATWAAAVDADAAAPPVMLKQPPSTTTTTLVRIANAASTASIELSPFDIVARGRSTPMVWFFTETLDPAAMTLALAQVLASFPVLAGRYASPPVAVDLTNAGVPVEVWDAAAEVADGGGGEGDGAAQGPTLSEAVARLPAADQTGDVSSQPCFFSRSAHEAFLPAKAAMDPGRCCLFVGWEGGTQASTALTTSSKPTLYSFSGLTPY
jgi:hypothetical protein